MGKWREERGGGVGRGNSLGVFRCFTFRGKSGELPTPRNHPSSSGIIFLSTMGRFPAQRGRWCRRSDCPCHQIADLILFRDTGLLQFILDELLATHLGSSYRLHEEARDLFEAFYRKSLRRRGRARLALIPQLPPPTSRFPSTADPCLRYLREFLVRRGLERARMMMQRHNFKCMDAEVELYDMGGAVHYLDVT